MFDRDLGHERGRGTGKEQVDHEALRQQPNHIVFVCYLLLAEGGWARARESSEGADAGVVRALKQAAKDVTETTLDPNAAKALKALGAFGKK